MKQSLLLMIEITKILYVVHKYEFRVGNKSLKRRTMLLRPSNCWRYPRILIKKCPFLFQPSKDCANKSKISPELKK